MTQNPEELGNPVENPYHGAFSDFEGHPDREGFAESVQNPQTPEQKHVADVYAETRGHFEAGQTEAGWNALEGGMVTRNAQGEITGSLWTEETRTLSAYLRSLEHEASPQLYDAEEVNRMSLGEAMIASDLAEAMDSEPPLWEPEDVESFMGNNRDFFDTFGDAPEQGGFFSMRGALDQIEMGLGGLADGGGEGMFGGPDFRNDLRSAQEGLHMELSFE